MRCHDVSCPPELLNMRIEFMAEPFVVGGVYKFYNNPRELNLLLKSSNDENKYSMFRIYAGLNDPWSDLANKSQESMQNRLNRDGFTYVCTLEEIFYGH